MTSLKKLGLLLLVIAILAACFLLAKTKDPREETLELIKSNNWQATIFVVEDGMYDLNKDGFAGLAEWIQNSHRPAKDEIQSNIYTDCIILSDEQSKISFLFSSVNTDCIITIEAKESKKEFHLFGQECFKQLFEKLKPYAVLLAKAEEKK